MSSNRLSSFAFPSVTYVTGDISQSTYVSSETVARHLGISEGVLRIWRYRKVGPPYLKMPGRKGKIMYHEATVLAYIASRQAKDKLK